MQGRWKGRDVAGAVSNSYSIDSGGNQPSVTASYASSVAVVGWGVLPGASASQLDPLAGFAARVGKRTLFMAPKQLALRDVDAKVTYTYVGQAFSAHGMSLSDSVDPRRLDAAGRQPGKFHSRTRQ
ncbi:hypothetical protein [Burkholderia aenigmatica]|uniref:hypothetical protein n=1 Tax=Burkholderia aenigmatica TaxID=2015348 RepID=UPI00264EA06F|nr:hypothetical protein [Burkholderia aenigmatica]MDN7876710.1 hypothetical protein [Burkholderia aenigmatica]